MHPIHAAAKQQDNEPTQPTTATATATAAATKPVHTSRPPVRSKSTEDLAQPAPAKPAISSHSPKIWKKKDSQAVKVSPSPSPRASPQLPRSKVGSGNKSSPGSKVKQERGATGVTDRSRASPRAQRKELEDVRTKNASPARTPSPKLGKKEEKKADVSPKPTKKEPIASKSPTAKSKKDSSASHPLTVVTVVEGSTEVVSESEAEPQLKVADIVKQLEPSSSPGAAAASPGKRKESVKQKPASKGDKKKEDKVKGKPDKDSKKPKEKTKSEKEKAGDREKEAKGSESPSHPPKKRGFFASLFRSKKSYDVAAMGAAAGLPAAKSPKHKRKSKKEDKQKPPPPEEQEPKPPTLQSRIEQLKQRGVATDSPDAQEEVLLATELEEKKEGEQGREEDVLERASSPLETITPPETPVERDLETPEENQLGGEAEAVVAVENTTQEWLPSPQVEVEEEVRTATVEETLRRLQPFFEASTAVSF